MGTLLIHPVHRRYIKLLRNQVKMGSPILLTQSDIDGFKDLCQSTKQKGKRHRGLYKLTLEAINRPEEKTRKIGVSGFIGKKEIEVIEKTLATLERRGLYATIMGSIIWYCRKHKFMSGAVLQSKNLKEACSHISIQEKGIDHSYREIID